MIQDFLGAVRFLTIFPVRIRQKSEEAAQLARSMFFFPLVGLAIGAAALGIFYVVGNYLPIKAATLLLILTPILLSGGLHVDGAQYVAPPAAATEAVEQRNAVRLAYR